MSRPEPVGRQVAKAAASGKRTLLLASLAVAMGALGYGFFREAHNPRFHAVVTGVSGFQHESREDVIAAAALKPGENAWLIDRRAARRRVEALPWVDRVFFRVAWPNRVSITVTERKPVAAVEVQATDATGPAYAVIDGSQRVLEVTRNQAELASLPRLAVPSSDAQPFAGETFADADVTQALAALRELRGLGLAISAVAIAPSTGISATADRNLRVIFGDDEDLARKAQLFQAIVAKISTPELVAYVDVRSVHAPTVLYR